MSIDGSRLRIFSTCPQSKDVPREDYLARVVDVARWSERYGCTGILVYTDNGLVDPWLVSQIIVQHTRTLAPLVAVQPIYMHPYSVAKMLATIGHLYDRRLYLNMVAGGFKNDLEALNDLTPHDRRYDRLVEYTTIIKLLLAGGTVSFPGEFYRVERLKMTPPLAERLFPGITISGSSEAGLNAARQIDATAIHYPKPPREYTEHFATNAGVRVGIIARESSEEAWAIAEGRFPIDRKGQITHELAMKTSDSVWHQQLSHLGRDVKHQRTPYWLVPFENYKTFCPYLVGSYAEVATELARYVGAGYETFILDIPPCEGELFHTGETFARAMEGVLV